MQSSAGCRLHGLPVELAEKFVEILACELPIEWLRRGFPVVLKIEQSLGEDVQVREVIRSWLQLCLRTAQPIRTRWEPSG